MERIDLEGKDQEVRKKSRDKNRIKRKAQDQATKIAQRIKPSN
jgi:hypothetical protein